MRVWETSIRVSLAHVVVEAAVGEGGPDVCCGKSGLG